MHQSRETRSIAPFHAVIGWSRFLALLLAFFVVLISAAPQSTRALEIEFSGRPVKLDILALYDGRRERLPHLTRIHKLAEMPLNHLGYRIVYHDVNKRLPSPQTLGRYRGIITWFDQPLARPDVVLGWLEQALTRGLKYVVMGEILPPETDTLLPQINGLLARLGLAHRGDTVDITWGAKVAEKDPELIGFERPLDKAMPGFPVIVPNGGAAEPHLILEAPLGADTARSIVVATGPGGGYAASNFTIYYEPNTDRERWILNPFAFFSRAFGAERRPIPDTTTLAGRRIYFSHIDGDGWNNVSEIEGHREIQRFSSEVIEREAIVPFPDLPVSVGLIAGDTIPALGGNLSAIPIARRLFALPQVEVATHTYTHPFNWQFFANYDRQEEQRLIDRHTRPSVSLRERFARSIVKAAGKSKPIDEATKYVAGSDDLPRTYLREPFDLAREITGALAASTALAPKGKTAKLYLWSGDTTPFPAAIRAVRQAGARNLNGGDSRYDAEFPSVAYIPALSRPAGDQRQIYAGNSNENTYTNDWTGPYHGQFMLEKTLANTEWPRRLKPFNLYYHMYSGEKPGALAAIKHILELARAGRYIPIHASEYAALADDFFSIDIVQVDLFSWAIVNRGTLHTVRFDEASQLALDSSNSKGVLGSNRHGNTLYVTLDPAVPRAIVTLRGRAAEQAARRESKDAPASLVESRWKVSGLERDGCGFRITAEGFGTGEMVWLTSPRRGYRVTTRRNGKALSEETRWADENGLFAVRLAPKAIEPLQISFTCHD